MKGWRRLQHGGYLFLVSAAVVFFGAGVLCFPAETAGGVSAGMALCLSALIPSTFPFVVLSAFCVYSGASKILGRVLGPLTRLLFHLPGCCGIVILLGWLGGYPTGARGVAALYQNGDLTQKQAEHLLWFCVNAGPSFTVSVIGIGLYGSAAFGLLLFCCQTGALLLLGIGDGILRRVTEKSAAAPTTGPPDRRQTACFSTALVLAANDGARGAANLCSFVMLFNALIEPLNGWGVLAGISAALRNIGLSPSAAAALFPLVWEITSGVNYGSFCGAPLGLVVFFTAAGGLCVLAQIAATTAPIAISKVKFLLSRLAHGGVSLLLFLLLRRFFLLPEPAASVFQSSAAPFQQSISAGGATTLASAVSGVVLLAACAVFLLCRKGDPLEKMR